MDDVRELDLTVDENNLLEEWQKQAALMLEYGIRHADALQAEDEARAALAVKTAELDAEIRAAPDEYGIGRVTEAAVAACVPTQLEHKVARKRVDKARHDARILQAAVNALAHRKSTLQGMTELFMRQWYADPASRDQPEELREATRKVKRKGRRRRPAED